MKQPAKLWFDAAYILLLTGICGYYFWPVLWRTWFATSDEYVLIAEVIRFLGGDFRQRFFDMPGTPLMGVTAIVWACYYAARWLAGLPAAEMGITVFTFRHLPGLFALMRSLTVIFYLLSIALVYITARKLTNRAGAVIAALFLAMSPIYASYSTLIRVESAANCLILAAILLLLRAQTRFADDGAREAKLVLFSGVLAGVAAACRFHSAVAAFPLLALMLILNPRPVPEYPRWAKTIQRAVLEVIPPAVAVLLILGFLAATTTYFQQFAPVRWIANEWHDELTLFAELGLANRRLLTVLWAGAVTLTILVRLKRPRVWIERALNPSLTTLGCGSAIGVLAGTPTILWQLKFYLGSVRMYSTTYYDFDRMTWPLLKNVTWFVRFYVNTIAPDTLTLLLIGVGMAIIILKRDRVMIPVLAAALIFFVSKPLNLIAAPHHVLCWLPFYAIIAGYGPSAVYSLLARWKRWGAVTAGLITFGVAFSMAQNFDAGPKYAVASALANEKRLHNIQAATDWIHSNTPDGSNIALTYFCFNSDAFFEWMRQSGLEIPKSVVDSRKYMIWWGEKSTLQGLHGYVCATRSDVIAIKKIDLKTPGEGEDPYTTPGFTQVATFGTQPYDVDLFKFDLPPRPPRISH